MRGMISRLIVREASGSALVKPVVAMTAAARRSNFRTRSSTSATPTRPNGSRCAARCVKVKRRHHAPKFGIRPSDTVAIVGAGPICLSAMLGAQLYSPGSIIAIDLADARLDAAKRLGAAVILNPSAVDVVAHVKSLIGA